MNKWRFSLKYLLIVVILMGISGRSLAATPSFFQGKTEKIEADPKKDYILSESDGNWFVMAKKFSGDAAALQAKRLVYEFRASYKMKAFVFEYDPDQMEMDALSKKLGRTKKFQYQTPRAVEYAVLVGGFPTGEDPALQKTLDRIRKSNPKSLQNDAQSQQLAARFKESAKGDSRYAGYGPLGGATPVPNPMLPIEYFNHKGIVDPFIAKLNSDSKYSLLNNKKMYTVRIATFSGDTSMKKTSDNFDELNSRLQYAGMRAAAFCEALRNEGVEAWEFHDRDCSFVTVGSFDEYGKLMADGRTELNPQIAKIIKKYGGTLANTGSNLSYNAYTVEIDMPDPSTKSKVRRIQVACDLRPIIIVVPQRSGEENVRKIALAQKQMNLARERREERTAALSLEEAARDLDGVNAFASANGKALTEQEYRAWVASQMQVQRSPNAPAASNVAQAQVGAQTAARAAANAPYAANANASRAAAPQSAPVNAQVQQRQREVAAAPRSQAPRVYATPPQQAKTAQRDAAPTY